MQELRSFISLKTIGEICSRIGSDHVKGNTVRALTGKRISRAEFCIQASDEKFGYEESVGKYL